MQVNIAVHTNFSDHFTEGKRKTESNMKTCFKYFANFPHAIPMQEQDHVVSQINTF